MINDIVYLSRGKVQWRGVNNKKNYLLTVDLVRINLCTMVMKTARFAITEKTTESVLTPPPSHRWGMRKSGSLRKVGSSNDGAEVQLWNSQISSKRRKK